MLFLNVRNRRINNHEKEMNTQEICDIIEQIELTLARLTLMLKEIRKQLEDNDNE